MLTIPRFQQTPDSRPLADTQRAQQALVGELNALPILNGRLIDRVDLVGGVSQNVPHGLGRVLQGWVIVRVGYPGATAIVQEASGNPDEAAYLRLSCAQSVSLRLWVF